MRIDIIERKSEILEWIEQKKPKAFICRQIRCKPETLESYLVKMGIDYRGNQGSTGRERTTCYITALEYIKKPFVKSHALRLKLLRDGIKEHKCEICLTTTWMDKPVPLELDHKDGNHYNNTLENIRLICPNCHAQTDSNSGKNVGRYAGMM